MTVAFVAGATGFTGREVVRVLRDTGVDAVAHVRPDSPRLAEWTTRFDALGVRVDTTPWDGDALRVRLQALRPDLVFCLVGTTRARGRRVRTATHGRVRDTYETVDLGLTRTLLEACRGLPVRFVYLSAAGTGPGARSAYGRARFQAEETVRASGLRHVIARPAIITGPGRDDARPLETAAARAGDGILRVLGLLGAARLEARLRSITGTALARALVSLALDPSPADRVAEADELQRLGSAGPRLLPHG